MIKNKSKNASMERHKWTKAEREYVKAIVHNYSFQRWTEQEIVQWLHDEKKIDIGRSTVNRIKNQMDREAEKWYIELKKSTYRYVAVYKNRIDSLYSYQKKLNQIIDAYLRPGNIIYSDTIIRAIAELHRIEMSIFSLWKQLPDLDIVDSPQQEESMNKDESQYINIETVMPEDRDRISPIAICSCVGAQQHYACYKCLRAFCRSESDGIGNNGSVRCPRCKTVVYDPPDPAWA